MIADRDLLLAFNMLEGILMFLLATDTSTSEDTANPSDNLSDGQESVYYSDDDMYSSAVEQILDQTMKVIGLLLHLPIAFLT